MMDPLPKSTYDTNSRILTAVITTTTTYDHILDTWQPAHLYDLCSVLQSCDVIYDLFFFGNQQGTKDGNEQNLENSV